MKNFKLNTLKICIFASIYSAHSLSHATKIDPIVSGLGQYVVNSNSSINVVNVDTTLVGISVDNNDNYSIQDNGFISIDLSNESSFTGSLMGVNVNGTGQLDLGEGSNISIDNAGGNSAIGISTSGNAIVNSSDTTINVNTIGANHTVGINIGNNSEVNLYNNSSINVTTQDKIGSSITAITLLGQANQNSRLNAANLNIKSDGTGINAQTNSQVLLTGTTVINSQNGGIEASGGYVETEKVLITTTGTRSDTGALFAGWGGKISTGSGSSIETENMHGIYATTNPGYPTSPKATHIDYLGFEDDRNSIQVKGQTGVTSYGNLAIVNLDNTDIVTISENSNTIGLRAINGGVINTNNTTVTASDTETNNNSIAAVLSRGNNSEVNFTGNTQINAYNTKNHIALQTDGNNSKISIKDEALIYGDVISKGNDNKIDLDLSNNSKFNGKANIIESDIDSNGNPIDFYGSQIDIQLNNSQWEMTGDSTISSLRLNNGAILNLHANQVNTQFKNNTLTILGDYEGNNSTIVFNSTLEGDGSITDKLIINGSASGQTKLKFNNIGGSGAQTENGIHIIQTDSSTSNAFYIDNGGYVSAGAYDYRLFLENNSDWYLKSHLSDRTPIYTPDAGSYLVAETMGNNFFISRLEDRGSSQHQNLGNKNEGNIWFRAYGAHNKFKTMDDQLKTTGNSFITQIGSSLITLGTEKQYNLGVIGGVASYNGKTRSSLTNREATTKINGYSFGLSGTWHTNPLVEHGSYIDSWILWNKFNNKISSSDQNQYKYDSSGITASIEVGGDYLINKNGKKNWWIQPQSQVIYQGVHADDFIEAQGVDVYHGKDNLQSRMGVKTYLNIPTNGNKLTSYRPYVALNFIHNTNPYSVVIDDVRYENEGSENLGELKLGVEGQLTKNSQVWLNASYVAGSHSNQAYQGNIGWKYNF